MNVVIPSREQARDILNEYIYDNPVLVKEFRTRTRGWKAYGAAVGYSLLMLVVLVAAYYFSVNSGTVNDIGFYMFASITWAQAVVLTFVVPSLTSGSLTQEREKKTIELLALTPLSATKMVIGKHMVGFLCAIALLACSLPFAIMCLAFGGISIAHIIITFILLIGWAFMLASAGVFISSMNKKTANASGNSAGLCILYFLSSISSGAGMFFMKSYSGHSENQIFGLLNPGWGPTYGLSVAKVFGISIPMAIVGFLTNVAYGALFILVASTHVRYRKVEKALPIRLILLGTTIFSALLTYGSNDIRGMLSTGNMLLISTVGASMLYMIIWAAIFATGEIKKGKDESMFRYALSTNKIFKSDVGGATFFMLLWTAASYGSFGLAIFLKSLVDHTPLDPLFLAAYFKVGVLILAIIGCMSAVGVLASCICKNRKNAVGAVILFALAIFFGSAIIDNGMTFGVNPGYMTKSAFTLSPISAIGEAASDTHFESYSWLIISIIYAGMGLVALRIADYFFNKYGGVQPEDI